MSAALDLADVTTELVTVLEATTSLPVGDGQAPDVIPDQPELSDFPYLIVYDITDTEQPELAKATAGTVTATWQITAVGASRLQCGKAIDKARALLDPAVTIETTSARVLARMHAGKTGPTPGEGGRVWNGTLRLACTVTLLV